MNSSTRSSRRISWSHTGITNTKRAESILAEIDSWATPALLEELGTTADPDQTLLALARMHDQAAVEYHPKICHLLTAGGENARRFLKVLGASAALGDHLIVHPEDIAIVSQAQDRSSQERTNALVAAVTGYTENDALVALRLAYKRELLQIVALDLAGDPQKMIPSTAAAMADLAAAALAGSLAIAQNETPGSEKVRVAIIGMGKTGARELNYISDVDIIPVAEPQAGIDEQEALRIATEIVTRTMNGCMVNTAEGALWEVDAALRPEGKQGQLVRTVQSHRQYYERWAKGWEFQALLKARFLAGDPEIGQEYVDAVRPLVWQASKRKNFVEDVQAMRKRVEDNIAPKEADRQIKLGRGGLRDIEFSVQLLQLVHGRGDDTLHSRNTLKALDALCAGGYVGRTDAADLDESYRTLRALEHRIQLQKMRRSHVMPTSEADLRRLGRSMGFRSNPVRQVQDLFAEVTRTVRGLQEKIFFRPLLSAVARLEDDDAQLSVEGAYDRFLALGYADPNGALRHIKALTSGLTRRAAIQKTLLPAMLHWFAQGADPDGGLLAFRRISDELGRTPWYMTTLREGSTAELLARVLAASRYAANLLERGPDAVAFLGRRAKRVPLERAEIQATMRAVSRRHANIDHAMIGAKGIRRRELTRIVLADLVGEIDSHQTARALTDLMSATIDTALRLATKKIVGAEEPLANLLVVGMGRYGGHELGYSSDADVMFVYEARPNSREADASTQALAIVTEMIRLLRLPGPDPQLEIDAELRPEGRNGPLVRSFSSYETYYERWSEKWEAQALLRADPLCGNEDLASRFRKLIDPKRWPAGGLQEVDIRSIRRLKARMEAERIPRGADRNTHFKLGPGGLSDVEWCVQLLQMQHAYEHPSLRLTETLPTMDHLVALDLLDQEDAQILREAWILATNVRNACLLWKGKASATLPSSLVDLRGIAGLLGYNLQESENLHEDYLRTMRRSRQVAEKVFYGEMPHSLAAGRQ